MRWQFLFFALGFLLVECRGEVINTNTCENDNNCELHEVRVEPCKEAPTKPCLLKRGSPGNITFDFTPAFDSSNMTVMPYWVNGATETPFADMDRDGCKYAECPLVNGKKVTYSYGLSISRRYPEGTFPLKWTITDDKNNLQCCFTFMIKIRK